MCLGIMCINGDHGGQKRQKISEARVMDSCESSEEYWKLGSCSLQEYQVLFTPEPFLQLP